MNGTPRPPAPHTTSPPAQGADPDALNASDAAPLHTAAGQGAADCARLLVLEAGARMGVRRTGGERGAVSVGVWNDTTPKESGTRYQEAAFKGSAGGAWLASVGSVAYGVWLWL